MRLQGIKIGLLCLFVSSCLFARLITKKHPMLKVEVPKEWQREAVVILCDTMKIDILKEVKKKNRINLNSIKETYITWYKINDPSNKDLLELIFSYSPFIESKPTIVVTAMYNKNKIKRIVNFKHEKELVNKWSLFKHGSGDNVLRTTIPDYKNIKILRIKYTRMIKQVQEVGHYYIRNSFFNTAKKCITVSWPLSYQIKYSLQNRENLKIKTTKSDKKKRFEINIESNMLPELRNTKNCKFPENWFSSLLISIPPYGKKSLTWRQTGQHYLDMINDSLSKKDTTVFEELATKIQWPQNTEGIINTAYNYVKNNIRYYGSWEKSYGWIPRDPKTILEKGYGDCKEMSHMLALLLRQKGVYATTVLLKRGRGAHFHPDYPSTVNTNHAITCVERSNGEKVYLDATSKNATSKTAYYEYINKPVLIIKNNASVLETVKPGKYYQNKIITHSTVKRDPQNSNWTITGTIKLYGEVAYSLYNDIHKYERQGRKKVTKDFIQDNLHFKASKVTVKSVGSQTTTLEFTADFNAAVLTSPAQGIILSIPSIHIPHERFSDLTYEGDRYLWKVHQEDSWTLPNKFSKLNFSKLVSKYGNGQWEKNGNTITRIYKNDFLSVDNSEREKLKAFYHERSQFVRGIAWSK